MKWVAVSQLSIFAGYGLAIVLGCVGRWQPPERLRRVGGKYRPGFAFELDGVGQVFLPGVPLACTANHAER